MKPFILFGLALVQAIMLFFMGTVIGEIVSNPIVDIQRVLIMFFVCLFIFVSVAWLKYEIRRIYFAKHTDDLL